MKLTEEEIVVILNKNLISTCTKAQKKQVFDYAFGEKFMASKDKGKIKHYRQEVQA